MNHHVSGLPPERYWTAGKVAGAAFLWLFGVGFMLGTWQDPDWEDPWMLAFGTSCALGFFVIPIVGYYLRHRDDEIWCPQFITHEERPAIHFPAEQRGMPVSAGLYVLLAAPLICLEVWIKGNLHEPPWLYSIPGLFFLSYTLFAVLGRFSEEGTFLTEWGVIIRARGLRARIPWSSIASSRTYRSWPFPFDRIAIDLHPGTPREVSTTVPWWVGSPRPRRNTVFLTQVQVPGFFPFDERSNPGSWIQRFAQKPPSADDLSWKGGQKIARTMSGFVPRKARRRARQRGLTR